MGKDGRHVHAAPPRNAHFCPPYSATAILNWVAVRAMVANAPRGLRKPSAAAGC